MSGEPILNSTIPNGAVNENDANEEDDSIDENDDFEPRRPKKKNKNELLTDSIQSIGDGLTSIANVFAHRPAEKSSDNTSLMRQIATHMERTNQQLKQMHEDSHKVNAALLTFLQKMNQ